MVREKGVSTRPTIIVVTGPTAAGKTAAALQVAAQDPSVEIVNADAQLLYRGFDIGTAKPSMEVRTRVRHHLIDILEPHERFSAADYSSAARAAIEEIAGRGRTPIVVGGTGFYIEALFDGLMPEHATKESLDEARYRYCVELAESSFEFMLERLRPIDPDVYLQIAREMNPIRLERAWTYYYATGISLGDARKEQPAPYEYTPEFRVLSFPRSELLQRIEIRVDEMLQLGWLDEVANLLQEGVNQEMPAMKAIGYRELARVVLGELALPSARELIIIRTRQYAKRQTTWMRRFTQRPLPQTLF